MEETVIVDMALRFILGAMATTVGVLLALAMWMVKNEIQNRKGR